MSESPLLPSLLGRRIREAEEESDRASGAVIGLVVDNKDPDKLGRVKVKYPTLPGEETSFWAPISSLGAGKDRGWWFLPEIDDEVLVMFHHGDFDKPVVVGALWNGVDTPPEQNGGGNERRVLVSREGSMIEFDDDAGTITIEDGGGVGRIVISDSKISMEAISGDLTLLAPAGAAEVVATDCEIQAQQGITITAGQGLKVGAAKIEVAASRITAAAARLDLNPGAVAPPSPATATPEDVPDPV